MKINLRPYAHDKSRWHVDIRLMHPCNPEQEIRKRKVAPAGLSEAQARAWGERLVPKMLREVLGDGRDDTKEVKNKKKKQTKTKPKTKTKLTLLPALESSGEMSLAEFYERHFDLEHLALNKPSTQESYDGNFHRHILPYLGEVPLVAISSGMILSLRATLRRTLAASTVNLVLMQLAKALRFAVNVGLLDRVPAIEKLREPKRRPKEVLSEVERAELLKAAASLEPQVELICLLGLHAGLRSSEMCALHWSDVDLAGGTITVQHNAYRGKVQTPKGTIGKVALSRELRRALVEHRRREPIGPLVLYRRSRKGDAWLPFTRSAITQALRRAQRVAGLRECGPHLLRHTLLTQLADLGASIYVIQAVARHSKIQTTQAYIHQQQVGLAREAAELLDRATPPAPAPGKILAKPAKSREKDARGSS